MVGSLDNGFEMESSRYYIQLLYFLLTDLFERLEVLLLIAIFGRFIDMKDD